LFYADRQTDITKLILAIRNFSNAVKQMWNWKCPSLRYRSDTCDGCGKINEKYEMIACLRVAIRRPALWTVKPSNINRPVRVCTQMTGCAVLFPQQGNASSQCLLEAEAVQDNAKLALCCLDPRALDAVQKKTTVAGARLGRDLP
jgi:hypothetical protein